MFPSKLFVPSLIQFVTGDRTELSINCPKAKISSCSTDINNKPL